MLPALGGGALALGILARLSRRSPPAGPAGTGQATSRAPYAERHDVPYSAVTQAASQAQAAKLGTLNPWTTAQIVGRLPLLGGALRGAILAKAKEDAKAQQLADARAKSAAAAAVAAAKQRETGQTGTAAQAATSAAVRRSIPSGSTIGATVDNTASHPGVVARPAIDAGSLSLLE